MAQASETQRTSRLRTEPSPKWVRARVGATFVADSRRARIVYVGPRPVAYAFPHADVRTDLATHRRDKRDHKVYGAVEDADVEIDGRRVERLYRFLEDQEGPLADHVLVPWEAADAWYEESEEVYVHPRDPYHRIDILQSSRHLVVERDGHRLAETHRPLILYETGLPPRYYLHHDDVRLELLRDSDKVTWCPYKGRATYHHVEVDGQRYEDLIWTYRTPFPESQKVQGLLCFFNERVDLALDGEAQDRPQTPWSEKAKESH